jgi:hypothetical protein
MCELLYTVVEVGQTELLIGDDWTHALPADMRKRRRVAFSDDCTLFMVKECWIFGGASFLRYG